MENKKIFYGLAIACISVLTSYATVTTTKKMDSAFNNASSDQLAVPTSFASLPATQAMPTDFTMAAEQSVHSVVHVKTTYKMTQAQTFSGDPFFDFFFGRPNNGGRLMPQQEQMATGSGVIISSDGYIVTNNHVVDRANEVEVTLNDKRTFKAKVIGADASTDIALLKIEADSLQPIIFGNSDNLKIGEWVLAVGNPFNLTSTVTAGIVSAKARNINILNSDMKIESFIQTDAAVNPGNSGGALVNTKGELVGINTAIASQTGSYAGYSFAVPTSIVSKVVADLKEFGVVQRAILGVQISDIDDKLAKEKKLTTLEGAYVGAVGENSAAKTGGIEEGDVIVAINNVATKSVAQLQEQIGRYRPGDKIEVTLIRDNKTKKLVVELKNRAGNTGVVKAVDLSHLGAKFSAVSDQFKYKFRIKNGLQISQLDKNGKFAKSGLKEGFVILKINNITIVNQEDIERAYNEALNNEANEKVLFITGIYNNGQVAYYAVNLE